MNIFTGNNDEITDAKKLDYAIVNIWDTIK